MGTSSFILSVMHSVANSLLVAAAILAPSVAPQFPIAALGGCADQGACHAYCAEAAHMTACTSYAQSHGLESTSDAARADAYASLLQSGGGPGGCTSPDACDAYCSTITNIASCVDFATAHNLTDSFVSEAEKVLTYIKSGGAMPGGCTSKASCESYCSDQSHAAECGAFFQKAGLEHGQGQQENFTQTQLQAFSTLLGNGQTPGNCTSLQDCLDYCNLPSHGKECGAFVQAMGFNAHSPNEQVTNGAQGPGGCTSKDSCDAYCKDPAHTSECKSFFQSQGTWQEQIATGTPAGTCAPDQTWNGSECMKTIAAPGNCNSPASCDAYCHDPTHADECKTFFQSQGHWVDNPPAANDSNTVQIKTGP